MEKTISENRWLPPSPHKEEVLKRVEAGRAHIEERGHNIPPVLVFEDGGVIELSKVRYMMTRRGMELVAADDYSSERSEPKAEGVGELRGVARYEAKQTEPKAEGVGERSEQTKHNDVCGTIDELKGLLRENPDLLESNPDHFNRLLDDACYMANRMQRRRENYQEFADNLAYLCERMAAIEGPETEQIHEKAGEIRAILRDSPETLTSKLEEIDELAEGIRDVANKLESCLSAYKKVAIEVGGLYENIKGGRNWKRN